jgi:hypothetical protein
MSVAALILAMQAARQGRQGQQADTEAVQKLVEQVTALADRPGRDGRDGRDGASIDRAVVRDGRLVLTRSTGDDIDVGPVTGPKGDRGEPGPKGESIVGPAGPAGRDGRDGEDGVGIADVKREKDNIVLTLDDGRTVDLGSFRGPAGPSGPRGPTGTAGTGGDASGAITSSGLTMNTARLLGRTTVSSGAIEEITPNASFSLTSGALRPAFRGVVLGRSSQGSSLFANNTVTSCPWNDEILDTEGWFNSGTSDTDIILNTTATAMRVSSSVSLDASWGSTGDVRIINRWYASDGTTLKGMHQIYATSSGSGTMVTCAGMFYGSFVSGDILRVQILQQSGGTRIYNSVLALSRFIVEVIA